MSVNLPIASCPNSGPWSVPLLSIPAGTGSQGFRVMEETGGSRLEMGRAVGMGVGKARFVKWPSASWP